MKSPKKDNNNIMSDIDYGAAYVKPNGNHVKVTMNTFRGVTYIHIREYMMDGDTGQFFPTKSGYALLAEEVDEVINLLQKASAKLGKDFKELGQGRLPLPEPFIEED